MIVKHHNLRKKLHELWAHRATAVFMMAAMVVVSAAATDWANALYILTGTEDSAIILDESSDVPDISSQLVYVTSGSSGHDVTLTAGQTVTVHHDGAVISVQSKEETISALLDRLHIQPGPLDMVGVDLSGDGAVLTVASDITYYDKISEPDAAETVRVANPELAQGTERVVQEGSDGVSTSVYEVVWSNGKQVSRQFVEELESTAVDEIVEYGTAAKTITNADKLTSVNQNADGSGTLVFASGATLNFSSAKSMTATAYTAGHGGADNYTATGTAVRVGTVAVDKNVIPLGTRMFIVTSDGIVYGMAVAEDTGVRGNKVDLYYDTYQQCINFGRRSCTVYILE